MTHQIDLSKLKKAKRRHYPRKYPKDVVLLRKNGRNLCFFIDKSMLDAEYVEYYYNEDVIVLKPSGKTRDAYKVIDGRIVKNSHIYVVFLPSGLRRELGLEPGEYKCEKVGELLVIHIGGSQRCGW